ncbi:MULTISPECIES: hypothetical protein [unclassified Cryobacterium]|uniref:hypothetical protein n=1 Tax=unclassified Cryobacterium TaxID=2649013 RepID=UPI00106D5BB8|nr:MULTISPECIES: hypothetical protein [unclassified Cryobacterium]TFC54519.1 hypothetical protein E3O68_09245 [Cryobacterium sp. TMB3-1-2]TFC70899.1 hypothetical protein E3T21_09385 [Cryobacterium sp. TMB3-15]TFC77352.1 hypothetical protein E3T22_06505 [Cryobacterium sp. TMB3-10]TFD45285.1 hypothetical protein E3T58_03130 [Cryobacterium sp. TMB3-12]
MFRIGKAGSASDYKVVDDERGVWIQFLASRGRSPGGVFKLVVGETVIPFETACDFIEDADGDGHLLTRFDLFGLSPAASVRGVAPNMMISPDELREYMLLAVEALLVFGSFYDGDSKPEGWARVELHAVVYTLASFGSRSGATSN